MKAKIKGMLRDMVEKVKSDTNRKAKDKVRSYHMILEEENIRLSVLYRPSRFVVSVHFVGGPNRGKTLARIVENDRGTSYGNYFNEDWLYPEANFLRRLV